MPRVVCGPGRRGGEKRGQLGRPDGGGCGLIHRQARWPGQGGGGGDEGDTHQGSAGRERRVLEQMPGEQWGF